MFMSLNVANEEFTFCKNVNKSATGINIIIIITGTNILF